jgi:MscS family membrane protein
VVGKILYWFTTTVVRRLTARTKTRLDDIVIDMIEEPIVFALTVAGIWYGLRQLTLPEAADGWIDQGVQFLIVIIITWLVARLLDALYREYLVPLAERTETDLDDQLLPIVSRGTKLAVWSLGVIVALNNAGYNVGALLAGLGIGGLALAMAAKDTVSNVFGGITIFTDQPFVINERVKVAGFDGVVKEIGMRSTRLETREGRLVTIPNSTFADRPVENVSRESSRRVVLDLGLTYDTTPEKMREALGIVQQIIEESPDLESKRTVSFDKFGDFALNIHVRYYIRNGADIWPTKSAVSLAIMERFAAAGLEMAFPTQTLYTRSLH